MTARRRELEEMWRYQAVARNPLRKDRRADSIQDGQLVIANIYGSWTIGRVMDFGGRTHSKKFPKTFAVCVCPHKQVCDPDQCASYCLERFWADVSQGGILGKRDLLRIITHEDPRQFLDPLNFERDRRLANEFLDVLESLEMGKVA